MKEHQIYLKDINKNIFVMNNYINFNISNKLKSFDIEIYNKIIYLNIYEIIKLFNEKDLKFNKKDLIYYDINIINKEVSINTTNLINYLINFIFYFIINYDSNKINNFIEILRNNYSYKEINNTKDYIQVYFNKNIFKDLFDLNLKLELIFNNKYMEYNIIDITYKINKNINDDNILIIKCYDLKNKNKDKENKNQNEKPKKYIERNLIKLFNHDCNYCKNLIESPTVNYLMYYLKILSKKFNISIDYDNIGYRKGYGVMMRDKNNFKIMFNHKYFSMGRRDALYFIVNQNIPFLNLNKGEFLGLICNNSLSNIFKNEIIYIVKYDYEYNNKFNIIIGFKPLKNDIKILSFEETTNEFIKTMEQYINNRKGIIS